MKWKTTLLPLVILAIGLVSFSPLHAQEGLREITHLYNEVHYEHCIRKAKSYIAKHPAEPLGYLMVGLSNLQLYFMNGDDNDELLQNAMRYVEEAHKHDISGTMMEPYSWEMNELYRVIRERGNELYNSIHKPSSDVYYKYLAEIYNDTTPEFHEFYADASPIKPRPYTADPDINAGRAEMVIKYAESLMGSHYRTSGMTPAGFDCSGYVCYVFGANHIDLPHGSASMATSGRRLPIRQARPSDLIFFGTRKGHSYHTSHVGIIRSNDENGNFTFIHSSTSAGVTIDGPKTVSEYWKKKILFVRRIME